MGTSDVAPEHALVYAKAPSSFSATTGHTDEETNAAARQYGARVEGEGGGL